MNTLEKVFFTGLLCASALTATAQVSVPSTFKHIAIDGSFDDWNGVPVAYTAPQGAANAIQYENVYVANDETNLYIRFTLYSARPNAFANSYDNIFIDADDNAGTGFATAGIGSEMLIQWGGGYQEKNGGFNEGNINNLGWNIAGSADSTDFEIAISLGATYASDGTPVFANPTLAILLEGDNTSYQNTAFAPPSGGLVYSLAANPGSVTTNQTLVDLAASSWSANPSGTDLGTNWLASDYGYSDPGWITGNGLFGYTGNPGAYPAIQTPLASGANTYYFTTAFQWANDTANLAFVVTNYLSDGAVYYLNGAEIRRVRMPAGPVNYATPATGTNTPAGKPGVFGIPGTDLLVGNNILAVETHQAPGSGADMVFGLSLTAATQYPVYIASTNLPASQAVLAGQPVTFTSDVIGSGPLSYQWFFDGTNAIAGANGPSYTLPQAATSNAGTYTLQVSNLLSSATTLPAVLSVSNMPVIITMQPAATVSVEGQPATLSVTVSATPPIQYQWSFDGNPIAGATSASYTIPATVPANAGVYEVTASNPASSTNSAPVSLTVLLDTIPPNLSNLAATANQITITFSKPVNSTTAAVAAHYAVSGGVSVLSATPNPANAAQLVLTTGVALNFGTVYTLSVNGVTDLYGNIAHVSGQFARDITIDGSFDDWTGLAPVYASDAPSGNTGAADFAAIYMYDDANYYYFYVSLWTDINASAGQFPYYVNMFFDTDNNPATGYNSSLGSEMLIQSGYSYQEKNGSFNDGYGINGLNWKCLPVSPGTNFEFQLSKAATFGQDRTPVFTTNLLNFIFQGMTPGFVVENTVPASGVLSYTNATPVSLAALPLGALSIATVTGGQTAVVWNPPGTLQEAGSPTAAVWTNLPAAASPYVIPVTGKSQFFRLTQ